MSFDGLVFCCFLPQLTCCLYSIGIITLLEYEDYRDYHKLYADFASCAADIVHTRDVGVSNGDSIIPR